MANKLKTGPATTAPKTVGRVVLVGTYKGDQLTRWRGWYNCPLDEEKSCAKAAKENPL